MRNFILGYIVGGFVSSFALSFLASYTKAIQRIEAEQQVVVPTTTEVTPSNIWSA